MILITIMEQIRRVWTCDYPVPESFTLSLLGHSDTHIETIHQNLPNGHMEYCAICTLPKYVIRILHDTIKGKLVFKIYNKTWTDKSIFTDNPPKDIIATLLQNCLFLTARPILTPTILFDVYSLPGTVRKETVPKEDLIQGPCDEFIIHKKNEKSYTVCQKQKRIIKHYHEEKDFISRFT